MLKPTPVFLVGLNSRSSPPLPVYPRTRSRRLGFREPINTEEPTNAGKHNEATGNGLYLCNNIRLLVLQVKCDEHIIYTFFTYNSANFFCHFISLSKLRLRVKNKINLEIKS